MPSDFVSIVGQCETEDCPNFDVEVRLSSRLDEHGCLPWWVCGVCTMEIIPNPHPNEEEIE
jgi:hypothetical protein